MAKELLAKRLIVELNDDGTIKTAQCQYKLIEDGEHDKMTKSITVDSITASTDISDILSAIIAFIKQGEGI